MVSVKLFCSAPRVAKFQKELSQKFRAQSKINYMTISNLLLAPIRHLWLAHKTVANPMNRLCYVLSKLVATDTQILWTVQKLACCIVALLKTGLRCEFFIGYLSLWLLSHCRENYTFFLNETNQKCSSLTQAFSICGTKLDTYQNWALRSLMDWWSVSCLALVDQWK